jgi:AcrR family transcriptional regulator
VGLYYARHMSTRKLTKVAAVDNGRKPRQEGTYHRVLDAAVELLRETKYSELTVRAIAARAEVSPATAYNYFKSKNGLIAEVYLRLVRTVPLFVDVNQTTHERVTQEIHALAMLGADEPEVAAATTTALMGDEEELRPVREQIGIEVRRRLTAALGPGVPINVLSTVEYVFYGALVRAGTGTLSYDTVGSHLDGVIEVILQGLEDSPKQTRPPRRRPAQARR